MVVGNFHEDMDMNLKGVSRGTAASVQSVSTSGGVGSPSTRSEAGMVTPPRDSLVLRLGHLEIQGDASASPTAVLSKKKKRRQRATGTDKSNRGLREFSMKVCQKVESKGRTTYNEVADELVAEYADANNGLETDEQGSEEKNISRRVYDALNVLTAMDIISKDKKEIQWKGLPGSNLDNIEEIKAERVGLINRIKKKESYLRELEEQLKGYQNVIHCNEQLYGNGNASPGGVALPFILIQTRQNASVEVEISEDMQIVHFDFNSTPFELHDDNYVLKQMKFLGTSQLNEAVSNQKSSLPYPKPYHRSTSSQTKPCQPLR